MRGKSKGNPGAGIALLLFSVAAVPALSQATATIHGQVTDPSKRSVPGAAVTLRTPGAGARTVETDVRGEYSLAGVVPGTYTISVTASGFETIARRGFTVSPGVPQVLDFSLALAQTSQKITVEEGPQIDIDPAANAGALVLRDKDLEALSSDRDDLAVDLAALAGPGAGPNGGQIYIDGFTGGRLPPKSSIREVRINQNPFSAQYDRIGMGRIEVFTKPGGQDFHGELQTHLGSHLLNSRNPFSPVKPPWNRVGVEGGASGRIGQKTSFSGDFEVRHFTENSFVNAVVLDDQLRVATFQQGVLTPRQDTEDTIRLDRQIGKDHTLSVRYSLARAAIDNQGASGFSLPSRIFNTQDSQDTIQASETGVFGQHLVNETRWRYSRLRSSQMGNASEPSTVVLDAFTGGGPPMTLSFTNQDRIELQNTTSLLRNRHMVQWGGRLRGVFLRDQDTQNYTGTFTFSSINAYRLTRLGLQAGQSPEAIRAAGGGASQFSLAGGNPLARINQFDGGFFVLDDWRIRPNVTLSAGLRYETQTNLSDYRNVAPRLSLAWGIGRDGKAPKTVLRAGAGIFYDRLSESLSLDALRRDGVHQQQFVIASPDFYPAIPSVAALLSARAPQAVRELDSRLRAPYLLQTAAGMERQLPLKIVLAVNYLHSEGWRSLRSRSIAAPLSAPAAPTSAIYLYEGSGIFRQDQLVATLNAKISSRLSFSGSYTLGKAKSDTDGAGTFPADSYDLASEYGRAGFDVRHRIQVNGVWSAPWGFRISPLLVATSGRPFNVTTGRDRNGDTMYTDRPAFAADPSGASVRHTAFGDFDIAPAPGQAPIPRNYGRGPGLVSLNVRLSKIFKLGKEATGKRDPMELTFSAQARNVLNHPNLALPVGNLSSPLFGLSTSLLGGGGNNAGVRRIEIQVKLSF